jgi:hypothetical protein
VDAEGFIPTFTASLLLTQYADLNGYALESEVPVLHDLKLIAEWLDSPVGPIDCKEALNAWNLFVDVARSVSGRRAIAFMRLDSQRGVVYNKLFWANNLPPLTPEGCHYAPEWSPDETTFLTKILSCGLKLFVSSTRSWPHEQ